MSETDPENVTMQWKVLEPAGARPLLPYSWVGRRISVWGSDGAGSQGTLLDSNERGLLISVPSGEDSGGEEYYPWSAVVRVRCHDDDDDPVQD